MNDLTQLPLQMGLGNLAPSADRHPDDSWFEAMAEAWGEALDRQAALITEKAAGLEAGNDSPSSITMLTAESLRMQFLSNSSHTALTAMGSALETMARKQ